MAPELVPCPTDDEFGSFAFDRLPKVQVRDIWCPGSWLLVLLRRSSSLPAWISSLTTYSLVVSPFLFVALGWDDLLYFWWLERVPA